MCISALLIYTLLIDLTFPSSLRSRSERSEEGNFPYRTQSVRYGGVLFVLIYALIHLFINLFIN